MQCFAYFLALFFFPFLDHSLIYALHLDLGTLATKPGYDRQGLGSALVQWGVLQAEAQVRENPEGPIVGLYLESTPMGLPMYLRNGFREVASMTHELGEGEVYKHVCLLKKVR